MREQHPDFPLLTLFDHPVIQHKLTLIRDAETGFRTFRSLLSQIAGLMLFEATRSFQSLPIEIRTPVGLATGSCLAGTVTVVPILRAGLGMAEGVLDLLPEARVGHIGLYRDEASLLPKSYLSKLPRDLDAGPVILVDPMLATGGSASHAVGILREAGATDIRFMCLVAAPPGVERFARDHPAVPIYAAALDPDLDQRGFIVPGLGDAGDRMYGTS